MRERLIEFVKESLNENIGKSCLLAENIADYLIGNGVIVPPCKVGDKAYVISKCKFFKNKNDVEEVVRGHWIAPFGEINIFEHTHVICSECNIMIPKVKELFAYCYCPNCGAKMDGGEEK